MGAENMLRWVVAVGLTPSGRDLEPVEWRYLREPLKFDWPVCEGRTRIVPVSTGGLVRLTRDMSKAYQFAQERAFFEAGAICGAGGWAWVELAGDHVPDFLGRSKKVRAAMGVQ